MFGDSLTVFLSKPQNKVFFHFYKKPNTQKSMRRSRSPETQQHPPIVIGEKYETKKRKSKSNNNNNNNNSWTMAIPVQ